MVCESSKQIGHTKGSGCGCSARLDLDVLELVGEGESTAAVVDRRALRRNPLDKGEREVDVPLERMGAWVWVGGSDGEIPAELVTEDALSMYFSIKRSLFQFMYRSKREAILASTPKMLLICSMSACMSFSTAACVRDS